jgi:hypothetical protein
MRTLTFLTLFSFLTASAARAQSLWLEEDRLEQARSLKGHGKWLLGLGVAHLAFGAALGMTDLAVGSTACAREPGCTDSFPVMMIAAGTFTAFGVIFAAVGAPLYGVGAHREKALLRPTVAASPTGASAGLTVSF